MYAKSVILIYHSISNKWASTAPILQEAQRSALAAAPNHILDNDVKEIKLVYVENNDRYILQKNVELMNGEHIRFDGLSGATVE